MSNNYINLNRPIKNKNDLTLNEEQSCGTMMQKKEHILDKASSAVDTSLCSLAIMQQAEFDDSSSGLIL